MTDEVVQQLQSIDWEAKRTMLFHFVHTYLFCLHSLFSASSQAFLGAIDTVAQVARDRSWINNGVPVSAEAITDAMKSMRTTYYHDSDCLVIRCVI